MTTQETDFTQHCLQRFQHALDQFTAFLPTETSLGSAMRYSLCAGGKRIRPLLVYASGEINDAPWARRDQAALSVEIIHTYSLIHDDLPCMDNADLRRNQPTCHRQFNEHIAVLAGDALQMHALHLLSEPSFHTNTQHQLRMIHILSQACGAHGMALGQAMDMSPTTSPTLSHIHQTHALKTGALFSACLQLGYLCSSSAINEEILKILAEIGLKIGIAFQIQDDILDLTLTENQLGKTKCDHKEQKNTYATLLGIETADCEYQHIYQSTLELLSLLPNAGELLRVITQLHRRQK